MTILWAEQALTGEGWQNNVRIGIDQVGRIDSIETDTKPSGYRAKVVLPAPANLHSHGFQRAVAGLTERRSHDARDNFWTWRTLIYKFLDQLQPDDIQAITAYAQMEMLESGFASVAEFHYVHHQSGGVQYQNIAELSERVIAAAEETGIGLTLLPVFYQYSGCGKQELQPEQLRFGNDPDSYSRLHEKAALAIADLSQDSQIGLAVHSMRAVDPEGMIAVKSMAPRSVMHMHVAEQVKEVEEIKSHYGVRPIEWLLENVGLDENWCLVHATHMTEQETLDLSKTGAVAGLCPITESNLGDGVFNGQSYFKRDGKFGIGTDSNIRISLCEELRTLEYSQRLKHTARAVLAKASRSTGRSLYDAISLGGSRALRRDSGSLQTGMFADILILDSDRVDLVDRVGDDLLDCFIFAGGNEMVSEVWSAGRRVVKEGQHVHHSKITQRYLATIKKLNLSISS